MNTMKVETLDPNKKGKILKLFKDTLEDGTPIEWYDYDGSPTATHRMKKGKIYEEQYGKHLQFHHNIEEDGKHIGEHEISFVNYNETDINYPNKLILNLVQKTGNIDDEDNKHSLNIINIILDKKEQKKLRELLM